MSCDRSCFDKEHSNFKYEDCHSCNGRDDGGLHHHPVKEIMLTNGEWESSKCAEDRLFLELSLAHCDEQLKLKHDQKAQEVIQLTKKSWYEGGWE